MHEPWRAALSVCDIALGREAALRLFPAREQEATLLLQAADAGLNAPVTTSMGRLFDAIASIAGIRETVSFEGQAAITLEQIADETEQDAYEFAILRENGRWIYDWRPVVKRAILDAANGVPAGNVSMRFHRGLAKLLGTAAETHRTETGCDVVALSGGCFQNELLLKLGVEALESRGFTVCINRQVPCNDGGISYGQAAVAARLYK